MKSLERLFVRRPRILNVLHACRLADAISQTEADELALLSDYAAGTSVGIEIGSFQGVSSVAIAAAMRDDGVLYCVDPWPALNEKPDPSLAIFRRNVARNHVGGRIKVLRGTSRQMTDRLPRVADFMFIDGDHAEDEVAFDWLLAKALMRPGGYVCLHDALEPAGEPWRKLGSTQFFSDVIRHDPEFSLVASHRTMAVMRRL